MARSAVAAEADGQPSVGLAHFIDYLEALEAGRIDGKAVAEITRPAPAIILSDAQGRGRASWLRRGIRADRRGGKRIRAGAVHAEERLHLRRARLFRRPAGRQRAGGDRRHQRPRPAGRFRLDQAGLLHQPDGLRRPGGRRPAVGHRPVVERHSLRQHPRRGEGRQADPRGLGARCRGPADHRCAPSREGRAACIRRAARRQHRADGRGARGRSQRRQMVARRAILHQRLARARAQA